MCDCGFNFVVCTVQALYSDDNIEIPQWMLSTESVHAKRMTCNYHPMVSLSMHCCVVLHVKCYGFFPPCIL